MDYNKLRAQVYYARQKGTIRDEEGVKTVWVTIEDLEPDDFKEFLTFTDKDSYLAWVSERKAYYAELTEKIRLSKRVTRDMQRAGSPKAGEMQASLARNGHLARILIALRKAGKKHSWALKQESKVAA